MPEGFEGAVLASVANDDSTDIPAITSSPQGSPHTIVHPYEQISDGINGEIVLSAPPSELILPGEMDTNAATSKKVRTRKLVKSKANTAVPNTDVTISPEAAPPPEKSDAALRELTEYWGEGMMAKMVADSTEASGKVTEKQEKPKNTKQPGDGMSSVGRAATRKRAKMETVEPSPGEEEKEMVQPDTTESKWNKGPRPELPLRGEMARKAAVRRVNNIESNTAAEPQDVGTGPSPFDYRPVREDMLVQPRKNLLQKFRDWLFYSGQPASSVKDNPLDSWVEKGADVSPHEHVQEKEMQERYRAALRTWREQKKGMHYSDAEALGRAELLRKWSAHWEKRKMERILLSASLVGIGAIGATGAIALSPVLVGSAAVTAMVMRGAGATFAGVGVYLKTKEYLEGRNFSPTKARAYASLAGIAAGGAALSGAYLFQHLELGDKIRDFVGASSASVGSALNTGGMAQQLGIDAIGKEPIAQALDTDAIRTALHAGTEPELSFNPDEVRASLETGEARMVSTTDVMPAEEVVPTKAVLPGQEAFGTESVIGSKGLDGLVDEKLMGNGGVLQDFNLSENAMNQFKDAVRRVMVGDPSFASSLLNSGTSVVRGGNVVFPDAGTLNMSVFGNEEFLSKLQQTIIEKERTHLLPALGDGGVAKLIEALRVRY